MKRLNKTALALATAGVLSSGVAQAALFDRGGGLIYDDVLKITWLSDANYAATQFAATGGTQGDADGRMSWGAANGWVDGLSYGGYEDWRLPTALNQDGNSEMGHMFYNNLGASAGSSILTGTNTVNLALFTNLQSDIYWVTPQYKTASFSTGNGQQSNCVGFRCSSSDFNGLEYEYYAWAVRPGDVAAVPEPEAYALLMAGLGLIGVVAKRRRRPFAAS